MLLVTQQLRFRHLIALTSVWTIACGTTPAADGGAGSAPIVNNGTAGAAGSVT
ncbi:MAG: hypothetical protein RL701_2463, partial [Pseudomonadota bacterium]